MQLICRWKWLDSHLWLHAKDARPGSPHFSFQLSKGSKKESSSHHHGRFRLTSWDQRAASAQLAVPWQRPCLRLPGRLPSAIDPTKHVGETAGEHRPQHLAAFADHAAGTWRNHESTSIIL